MSSLRRVVVLGTGTDIGKTYVGVQLLRTWKKLYGPALGLKPVESGISPEDVSTEAFLETDAGRLGQAASAGAKPLYSLKDAISPHLAAERENRTINLNSIVDWVEEKEKSFLQESNHADKETLSLVESAGGAFSPLCNGFFNVDLQQLLNPSIRLLIAPDSVGVLHDVNACLRAMQGAGVPLPHVLVLSGARSADATTGTNRSELQRIILPSLGLREIQICTVGRNEGALSLASLLMTIEA